MSELSNSIKSDSQRKEHWALYYKQVSGDFPGGEEDGSPPVTAGTGFYPWSGKIPTCCGAAKQCAAITGPTTLEPVLATRGATTMRSCAPRRGAAAHRN